MLPRIAWTNDRSKLIHSLQSACESAGAFVLKSHDVDMDLYATIKKYMQLFFALPLETKLQALSVEKAYRGYLPLRPFDDTSDGSAPVQYEALIVGEEVSRDDPAVESSGLLLYPNIWTAETNDLRYAIERLRQRLTGLRDELLRSLTSLYSVNEEWWFEALHRSLSNISLCHFPMGNYSRTNSNLHRDAGLFTIIAPDPAGGLEYQGEDGLCHPVEFVEGELVIMIGEIFSYWTGGHCKSMLHRVHPLPGQDRYSISFFTTPSFDTVVKPVRKDIKNRQWMPPLRTSECFNAIVFAP